MENQSGIYEILNTVNGKRYIGSTSNFARRRTEHKNLLRCGAHHSPQLQHAWNKYGEVVFQFTFLFDCAVGELIDYENAAMDHFKPAYNNAPAAGTILGLIRPPETRAKMSASLMGNKRTLGHVATPESRAKMSEAQKGNRKAAGFKNVLGHRHTPETRARIGESQRGRKMPPRSEEWKAKQRAVQIGQIRGAPSEETKRKLSEANKGQKRTVEQRARMSKSHLGNKSCLGRVFSADTIAKMSASHKAVQAKKKLLREQAAGVVC